MLFLILSVFHTKQAFAHVGYVIPQTQLANHAGTDFSYVVAALGDPTNLLLIVLSIGVFVFLYYLSHKNYFLEKEVKRIRKTVSSYTDIIPWILRLSLGIALMGASVGGNFISPLLPTDSLLVTTLELVLGFLLLLGALLEPTVVIVSLLFIFALGKDYYLLGNLEFLAGGIALLFMANPRPGFDHIVGIQMWKRENMAKYIPLILRVGIGISMVFLALYEKILNPGFAELVITKYNLASTGIEPAMWIFGVGFIELLIGFLLLIGYKTRLTSAIAFCVLIVTFFYFKEDVYSHVTLFGVLSVLFITDSGMWSIDSLKLQKKPVKRRVVFR